MKEEEHLCLCFIFALASASRSASFSFCSYVASNFYSNFWLFFGKLGEARFLAGSTTILKVNTRLKALEEIYKSYTPLHLWNPIEKH